MDMDELFSQVDEKRKVSMKNILVYIVCTYDGASQISLAFVYFVLQSACSCKCILVHL